MTCDGCGEVVKGRKGVVAVNKSNFAIRGMITYFGDDGEFIHITRHQDEDNCFCDTNCFKEFCNRRLEEVQKRRREALMREVSDDIVHNRQRVHNEPYTSN